MNVGKLRQEAHDDLAGDRVQQKADLRCRIRALKAKRDDLIAARDSTGLKVFRKQVHGLKRRIRKIRPGAGHKPS